MMRIECNNSVWLTKEATPKRASEITCSPYCRFFCENGGSCVAPGECQCQEGFAGERCETRVSWIARRRWRSGRQPYVSSRWRGRGKGRRRRREAGVEKGKERGKEREMGELGKGKEEKEIEGKE